jgi:hypothetical protein
MYKPRGWHIAGGIEQRASFLVQIERVRKKRGKNERRERSVGNGGVWFKRGRRRVGAYDGPSSKGLERGERGGMMDGRSRRWVTDSGQQWTHNANIKTGEKIGWEHMTGHRAKSSKEGRGEG